MNFQKLNTTEYDQLVGNSEVLKTRREKPVIMLRDDNRIIKHIYHRKGLSSSRIWPYAKRFVHNSRRLQQRGVRAPIVDGLYRVPELGCDIVTYPKIEGMSVREHWQQGNTKPLENAVRFIAHLHQQGIFFRDLHLANLIVTDDGFALIDLASVRIKRRPLTRHERQRNLSHLFHDYDDGPIVQMFGKDRFYELYRYESPQHHEFLVDAKD